MELVVACVVLTVDMLFGDVSVELMLVGTVGFADVVGDTVEVLISVLMLLAALSEATVGLSVDEDSADVLADVTGVVDVVVLMALELWDIVWLPVVDNTVVQRRE